ncbi:Hsp20 family protein [Promethearchaeum syntrophicum]|uniref:Hsp20 family protein n=1 Tax=Promethearchaeum syntrophicum TaxID=2594042 RepID=A0A5B9D5Q5_9ARCH|nr:Hsp20/alpha crystallin family protein [Candidatus Prometheoarchaeum syntrophicum]QEE14414.1 Hsp20/alpha crystallin family protein [Candidatus Prometheoarchaeum syntrophicum]
MENTQIQKKENNNESKSQISPIRYFNYNLKSNSWDLEIHIPGVKKEDIHVKFTKDAYNLEAQRKNDFFHIEESFPFNADVNSIKGEYANGLLKIEGNIEDPLSKAFEIKLK